MILELLLSLFPGILIIILFFKKEPILSKIILFFIINIIILTLLGLILGFNEFSFRLTGGLVKKNILIAYSIINISLLLVLIIKKGKNKK